MRLPFASLFALEHILWDSAAKRIGQRRQQSYPKLPRGLVFDSQPLQATNAEEAMELFAGAGLPVIWKGGAGSTSLMRWTTDYLKSVAGEIRVKILALPGLGAQPEDSADQVMPLSQYIDQLPEARSYLRFSDLIERSKILQADLPLELLKKFSGARSRINLQFFLGPGGARTPLHAEMNCNIFIQVFGKKRWLVLPAGATPELAVPAAHRFYFFSEVDAFADQTSDAAPNVLQGIEILLEPGDILLCPPLVWHAVENLTASCSVGYKFNDYLRALRTSPLLFGMNTLARNPSYFTYLWQTLVRRKHPILSSE
ncbi:MAG: cupin-like domain-containing protein [Spirochaetota bacterium]